MLPICARSTHICERLRIVSSPFQVQQDHCGHLSRTYRCVTFWKIERLNSGSLVPKRVQKRADNRLGRRECSTGVNGRAGKEEAFDIAQQASSTTEVQFDKMMTVSSR